MSVFLKDNKDLIKSWDYKKNTIDPNKTTCGSVKKAWWICEKGHSYDMRIDHRNNGHGCPYCSGRRPIIGETDLLTINPELCKEWNYEKNEINPNEVSPSSEKKVWWKCSKGHEWQASICNRNKGRGCPFCAGKRLIKDVNDLATIYPDLAKEWNYEKNGSLTPHDVMSRVATKVWWKCSQCNHEWISAINNRVAGNGCPNCHYSVFKNNKWYKK